MVNLKEASLICSFYNLLMSIYFIGTNSALYATPFVVYGFPTEYIVGIFNIVFHLVFILLAITLMVGITQSTVGLVLVWIIYSWIYLIYTVATLPIALIRLQIYAPGWASLALPGLWAALVVAIILNIILVFCTFCVFSFYRELKSGHFPRLNPVQAYQTGYSHPNVDPMAQQHYNQGFQSGSQGNIVQKQGQ